MKKHFIQGLCSIAIILQILTLSACGGGGSSSGGGSGGTSNPTPSSPDNPNTPNNTKPTVSITPANNATNVGFRPLIQLQFSESVTNVTESTVTLSQQGDGLLAISSIKAESNNIYTFLPRNPLTANTKYTIIVKSGITALTNKESIATTSTSFTTLQNHYAYITSYNTPTLTVCSASVTDGSLNDCKQTGSGFSNAYGVAVNPNGLYAYVANMNGAISVCNISNTDGTLSNCTSNQESNIPAAYGVAVDPRGKYLYVATLKNYSVARCEISKTDGSISNCVATTISSAKPYGIAIYPDGEHVSVTDSLNKYVSSCYIDNDGLFYGCKSNSSESQLSYPTGIAVDKTGENIYITNSGVPSALSCYIDFSLLNAHGKIYCGNTGSGFKTPADIKLDLYSNFAYVTNNSLNTISICAIEKHELYSYPVFSNCQASTGNSNFNSPEMIAVY